MRSLDRRHTKKQSNRTAAWMDLVVILISIVVAWQSATVLSDIVQGTISGSPFELFLPVKKIGISLPQFFVFIISFLLMSWLGESALKSTTYTRGMRIVTFLVQFALGLVRLGIALSVFFGLSIIFFEVVAFIFLLAFGSFPLLYAMLFAVLISFSIAVKGNHMMRRIFHE